MTEAKIEVANLKAIIHNLEALKVGYVGNIKDIVCTIDIEFFLQQAIDTAKHEINLINKTNKA